jgi:hypothetical protein
VVGVVVDACAVLDDVGDVIRDLVVRLSDVEVETKIIF